MTVARAIILVARGLRAMDLSDTDLMYIIHGVVIVIIMYNNSGGGQKFVKNSNTDTIQMLSKVICCVWMWTKINPFPHIDVSWRLYSRQLFENIVTKEEIAQIEKFLLLQQCFPLLVIDNHSIIMIFHFLTKYVQSRLLQNCCMRERVKWSYGNHQLDWTNILVHLEWKWAISSFTMFSTGFNCFCSRRLLKTI